MRVKGRREPWWVHRLMSGCEKGSVLALPLEDRSCTPMHTMHSRAIHTITGTYCTVLVC